MEIGTAVVVTAGPRAGTPGQTCGTRGGLVRVALDRTSIGDFEDLVQGFPEDELREIDEDRIVDVEDPGGDVEADLYPILLLEDTAGGGLYVDSWPDEEAARQDPRFDMEGEMPGLMLAWALPLGGRAIPLDALEDIRTQARRDL